MNILILDTTDSELVVALVCDSKSYTASHNTPGKKHNAMLLPSVEQLLEQASITLQDVDAIACVQGPGSFTGIRLGVTTANALSRGLNKPIIALNTLEVMAHNTNGRVLSTVDANHGNYYCGIYNDGVEILLDNMTTSDLQAFEGTVVSRDDNYCSQLVSIATTRYQEGSFVQQATPMYMKLSQAERELNGNTKS